MSSPPLRYIRHGNNPPTDLGLATCQDIQNVLSTEVKRVQNHVAKTRKTGSVYVGITGSSLMAHHLSTAPLNGLPGLSPAELLAFTDTRLTQALSLSPTSLSSPSSGSHSSFLETAVGIATMILIRTVEVVIATSSVSTSPFCDSWTACAQIITSATSMAVSEDRRSNSDDDGGCEVLYGRAGLLYALLRLRSASKRDDIKTADSKSADLVAQVQKLSSKAQLQLVVQSIIHRGQSGAANYSQELAGKLPAPPLMWTWHGKRYLGAAHGVGKSTVSKFNTISLYNIHCLLTAGIIHILLLCPADVIHPYMESILLTVEWLIGCQDPHGNWPTAAPIHSSPGRSNDLIQWCHGATGILLLLCTVLRSATQTSAAPLLGKVIASVQAGAGLVYRHGLLSKGVGLCHGVGGSVFALLAVSDVLDPARTKKSKASKSNAVQPNEVNYYLVRAVHLAQLAASHEALTANGEMGIPDHPWSLYEGMAGMCCAWAEVLRRLTLKQGRQCDRSGMPGFDDVDGDTWASW
ncbi:Lanthionine synthetase c family protein [Mycena venus]|uniref:Lanthionine synthetase c family protein n=1 Tax=Mycena venus TaxID=2733690 RepID=A0A8H6Z454_9AGAR|nr:Lanthionine synthetase c family protein [Mycena venus]